MIILGIDPGTATTGYGVIKVTPGNRQKDRPPSKTSITCLGYGLIQTSPSLPFGQRLDQISRELRKIIRRHRPELVALESVFFFKNLKTFIPVSRACGVVILETTRQKIPWVEFTPPQIKAKVTNYGRAEKPELQKKIQQTLKLKDLPRPDDVADALAVALCAALSNS